MKLEDQVVSLELAKKLRQLGFKQNSYFHWCISGKPRIEHFINMDKKRLGDHFKPEDVLEGKKADYFVYYSAYTVAELGEILPLHIEEDEFMAVRNGFPLKWRIGYGNPDMGSFNYVATGDTEANSRANMLIYLKENGLLTSTCQGCNI
jgi:hypothetical protein